MIVYREAKTLARDLGFSIQTLYAVSNSLPRHYHSAELPKRDGTVRHLSVPDPAPQNHPAPHCGSPAAPSARLPLCHRLPLRRGPAAQRRSPHGKTADFEAGHSGFFRQRTLFCCEGICLSSFDLRRAFAGPSHDAVLLRRGTAPGGAQFPGHFQSDPAGLRPDGWQLVCPAGHRLHPLL